MAFSFSFRGSFFASHSFSAYFSAVEVGSFSHYLSPGKLTHFWKSKPFQNVPFFGGLSFIFGLHTHYFLQVVYPMIYRIFSYFSTSQLIFSHFFHQPRITGKTSQGLRLGKAQEVVSVHGLSKMEIPTTGKRGKGSVLRFFEKQIDIKVYICIYIYMCV